jgi:hypothetical protein
MSHAMDYIATGQVTVEDTATLIVAARHNRRAVLVINEGSTDVRVGVVDVDTATGALLTGVKGASVSIPTTAAVYGIVASGTQAVSYVEVYG